MRLLNSNLCLIFDRHVPNNSINALINTPNGNEIENAKWNAGDKVPGKQSASPNQSYNFTSSRVLRVRGELVLKDNSNVKSNFRMDVRKHKW